ncbi:S8 family peptidase [Psychroflexus salis]|uniref:Peptidase S8/S53 domain-containing protein n=1 Tax=Psychroflexus salis TaxID=1526574 RepID=A0A917E683_9FLAO|nr:S8/S53 family peptidase [Psychroflexus salis]GGE07082.1 hypothetical protein GCM10010831_05730 [Psychroflexus salis]
MGAAAADTNNSFGIVSIGYDSSLIPFYNTNFFHHTAALYLAENYDEIKVVNISMSGTSSYVAGLVFKTVWEDEGVTIVAAAGNGWQSNSDGEAYYYPASFEHVISVSSVGSQNKYGTVDENNRSYDWKDVHQLHVNNPNYTHQHNDKVDLVAPGYSVATTTGHNGYRLSYGTSFASPMVAGTVALMYEVYPGITPDEVKQILQSTADDIYHIPENQPYIGELGAGRLNAYAAVLTAKCIYEDNPNPDLDLMMQNSKDDFGVEPNTETDVIWNSPDIWVRNQPDGHLYMDVLFFK